MNRLIVSLVVVAFVGCSESASPPITGDSITTGPTTDERVKDEAGQPWARTGYEDLQPLGSAELPQRTREPPDPSKDQYERAAVRVVFGEVFIDEAGDEVVPEIQVVERYLSEYLRRSGFRVVADAEAAEFTLNGRIEAEFDRVLQVQGRDVAYKVVGRSELSLTDRAGKELAVFKIPEVPQESVESVKSAFLELRRLTAKLQWERLRERELFGDAEIASLLLRLLAVSPETPAASSEAADTTEIIQRLAARGVAAVPFMIDALTDTRAVEIRSSYPGLAKNSDQLRVYHIADKVLEEIFQKVSRMGLNTPNRSRFLIIEGWEGLWKQHCPSFREATPATAAVTTE